jgi:xanthine dehydrogenase accessory factor
MIPGISARMRQLADDRVPFVHAVVVRAQFPTSVSAGDDAIVLPDGSIEGFVGGQCAQSSVRAAALGALRDGRTVLLRVLPEGEQDFPHSPGAQVVVNPCLSGGAMEIFLQPSLPPPVIWVVGDSPIAEALAQLAGPLDFAVRRTADGQGPSGATAVVVSSHGRDETATIRAALDAGVGFVGLVASRRRGAAALAEMGLTEAERGRIHTPAGVEIGARTAHEIALSILAEIVAAIRTHGLTPAPAGSGPPSGDVTAASGDPVTGSGDLVPPSGTAGGAGAMAVDPVCGMTVTPGPDTPHLVAGGEHVWFCGPGCRSRYAGHIEQGGR